MDFEISKQQLWLKFFCMCFWRVSVIVNGTSGIEEFDLE